MSNHLGGSRQAALFALSKQPTIPIEPNHRLVIIADELDWTSLEEKVQVIRLSKLKNTAGRPPHLRALMGALLLKAMRDATWRETEDLIRHYAPARYLCGLTETTWTPDFRTLHDFGVLMGEDGVKLMNEFTVKWAVAEKLADPTVVVADTTAQEAAIPHPNEMGLMAGFLNSVLGASKRAGKELKEFATKAADLAKAGREKLRDYRLFAKTKEKKEQMVAEMARVIEKVQRDLGRTLKKAAPRERLHKYSKVARDKVGQLHETMKKLLPQIRYWLKTGFVAKGKVISLHVAELYSIVRGKAGKKVEFGLNWGMTRLRGGFLLATLAKNSKELVDSKFVQRSVDDHIKLFGEAPQAFAYDRAGYSEDNVAKLKKKGVRRVGLAPRGQKGWAVSEKARRQLIRERALVEAGIGAVKSSRYNFHRPRAHSVRMMGASGQLGVLGFNLNKMVRGLAEGKVAGG